MLRTPEVLSCYTPGCACVCVCVSEVLLLPFNILIEVPALKMHAYP